MLPGFRFLFIATVMSVSVMVFGLGAAALLRATHENFATFPQRRPPEQVFVKTDTLVPVIAMLRVEPEPQPAAIAAPAVSAPAVSAPAVPRDEPPAIESKSEVTAAPPAESVAATPDANASAPTRDESVPGSLAALNTPEPASPVAGVQQPDTERATGTPATEAAAPVVPAAEAIAPVREAAAPVQAAPAPDQTAATGSVRVTALGDGGDAAASIAEARKKAEAAKARTRDLEAARRARAAKLAAQRRRIAIIRAREARKKQQQEQQQPFAPLFN